jgi:hypothetical protein
MMLQLRAMLRLDVLGGDLALRSYLSNWRDVPYHSSVDAPNSTGSRLRRVMGARLPMRRLHRQRRGERRCRSRSRTERKDESL